MSALSGWAFMMAGILVSLIGNPLIKASNGFEKPLMGSIGVGMLLISAVLWGFALKTLPLATAHVVWSGVSAIFIVAISMLYFHEAMSPLKVLFLLMVLVGCVGLKVIEK